jgi:chromosome segregation ATPase
MSPIVWVGSGFALIGGIIGAILAIFKLSPERQSIFITTAQGAVVVQAGVIDDLREEIQSLRIRVDACANFEVEIRSLHRELEKVQDKLAKTALERDRLKHENDRLQSRVATLETEVGELKNGNH